MSHYQPYRKRPLNNTCSHHLIRLRKDWATSRNNLSTIGWTSREFQTRKRLTDLFNRRSKVFWSRKKIRFFSQMLLNQLKWRRFLIFNLSPAKSGFPNLTMCHLLTIWRAILLRWYRRRSQGLSIKPIGQSKKTRNYLRNQKCKTFLLLMSSLEETILAPYSKSSSIEIITTWVLKLTQETYPMVVNL